MQFLLDKRLFFEIWLRECALFLSLVFKLPDHYVYFDHLFFMFLFASLASFEQTESEPQDMACEGEVLDAGWVVRSGADHHLVSITSITGFD